LYPLALMRTTMKRSQLRTTPSFKGLRATTEAASRAMRGNRRADTKPELLLRRAVWRLGLRYRKNVGSLPGRPDLVFTSARIAVFCDGDFWHGRDWSQLKAKLLRRANAQYWTAKIETNMARDLRHNTALSADGWYVIRVWESDILLDPDAAARRIHDAARPRPAPSHRST
jgi:DNA mismatch endonuclease, patch repair protein